MEIDSGLEQKIRAIKNQTVFFVSLASVFVVLGFLAGVWGFLKLKNVGFEFNNLGTFGSYLQGAVASLWSLAALFFIYVAFLGQRQQLAQQEAELEGQKEQFTRQSFENSFFQLLNLHQQIVSQLTEPKEVNVTGRSCFQSWYSELREQYDTSRMLRTVSVSEERAKTEESYLAFYKSHQGNLGHYFRNLYHIFKFVNMSDIADKRRYTSLIRAQLSQHELVMLFYNCITPLGVEKFKTMIEEFGLLENMEQSLLLNPEHVHFFDLSAYR